MFISRPSTDLQARQLAAGELNEFAAWRVEARAVDQLLLCAIDGRTRSWLMVSAADVLGRTRLYFGSAVVRKPMPPNSPNATGMPTLGFVFKALLGFHKVYSRALLCAAAARLEYAGARRLRVDAPPRATIPGFPRPPALAHARGLGIDQRVAAHPYRNTRQ